MQLTKESKINYLMTLLNDPTVYSHERFVSQTVHYMILHPLQAMSSLLTILSSFGT